MPPGLLASAHRSRAATSCRGAYHACQRRTDSDRPGRVRGIGDRVGEGHQASVDEPLESKTAQNIIHRSRPFATQSGDRGIGGPRCGRAGALPGSGRYVESNVTPGCTPAAPCRVTLIRSPAHRSESAGPGSGTARTYGRNSDRKCRRANGMRAIAPAAHAPATRQA